ncbi:MAG: hypothetical protein ABIK07_22180 [Planctomycetota bacterium]
MTLAEAGNLFDKVMREHRAVARRNLVSQRSVEKALDEKSEQGASDSSLIAAVMEEASVSGKK